jgi:hypothetical protein
MSPTALIADSGLRLLSAQIEILQNIGLRSRQF